MLRLHVYGNYEEPLFSSLELVVPSRFLPTKRSIHFCLLTANRCVSKQLHIFLKKRSKHASIVTAQDEYRRLLIRWFQFGVFTPIFRVHGAGSHTEIWNFGNTTMDIINISAITLRYRLLPYATPRHLLVQFYDVLDGS